MFLQSLEINPQTSVHEIVSEDYRTAEVFRKYEIEYCCGGRWPLSTACMIKGLEPEHLIGELYQATRTIQLSPNTAFEKWDIDFLADYIINVHHSYLRRVLPEIEVALNMFVEEHHKKYPYLPVVEDSFRQLQKEMLPHMEEEEDIIFPYIRQIFRARKNKDSYAGLLVRTLRKPVKAVMNHEHDILFGIVYKWRELLDNYKLPEKACVSHKVVLSRLKELDNDIVQHMYLENEILFPKAIQIEKEILQQG
jgi:regulator of cell morphogenesis and NO signaling